MPEFIVKLGDQTLQTRRFDGELLRIGRSRENDIVLENLSVSREHATVRFHKDQFILTDLNSANGTLVNGVRVTKTEIVDEDVITIGKHKLHFRNPVIENESSDSDGSTIFRTVMVEPKAEAWLTVESGRLAGREFRITRFETSLGKAPTNDIVLTGDWLLAKKQAIILRKGNHAFEIQDLGGLRGVKLNGEAITDKSDLKDNDTIEMAGTRLVFHCSVAASVPTGRVPSELPAEAFKPAIKILAPAVSANGKDPEHPPVEDSLDLEEGYKSIRIAMKSDPITPDKSESDDHENSPELADDATGKMPAVTAEECEAPNLSVPEQETPVAVKAAMMEPNPSPRNRAESARNHVFDDQQSTGRRRRKHHQRAAMKEAGAAPSAADTKPSVTVTKSKIPPPEPASIDAGPTDQEIKIWEEALKNPSPAIKRQAARMLKKLTGRNYDV